MEQAYLNTGENYDGTPEIDLSIDNNHDMKYDDTTENDPAMVDNHDDTHEKDLNLVENHDDICEKLMNTGIHKDDLHEEDHRRYKKHSGERRPIA